MTPTQGREVAGTSLRSLWYMGPRFGITRGGGQAVTPPSRKRPTGFRVREDFWALETGPTGPLATSTSGQEDAEAIVGKCLLGSPPQKNSRKCRPFASSEKKTNCVRTLCLLPVFVEVKGGWPTRLPMTGQLACGVDAGAAIDGGHVGGEQGSLSAGHARPRPV